MRYATDLASHRGEFQGKMRIGILQCDDVVEPLCSVHGNYPGMFQQWLRGIDPNLVFTVWRCHDDEIPETGDGAEAWIITGSKYGLNDGAPWMARLEGFIRLLHQRKRPLVGMCFGHQLIARALEGNVRRHPGGWGVGVSVNDVKHRLPWTQPWKPTLNVLVSHQDQVHQIPPGSMTLAASDFCEAYMILVGDTILEIQGHPEFPKAYANDLMELRRGMIPDDVLEKGQASL